MREVDAILERIDRKADIGEIRNDMADLLSDQLQRVRDRLRYWEKAHFANAIVALAWNIRARHQPTTSWLRLCPSTWKKRWCLRTSVMKITPLGTNNSTHLPMNN